MKFPLAEQILVDVGNGRGVRIDAGITGKILANLEREALTSEMLTRGCTMP